ncbi:MAG: hypothetical protein WD555_05405 [Fulvivirga sp.]
MNKFLTGVLLLNLSLFQQMAAQEDSLPEPYLNYTDNGLVYNTVFQYKDFSFSGLMVVKQEAESYHVVLLSKLGVTIIDLLLTDGNLIWKKVPEAMDKKTIRHFMEKDFNLLFLTTLQKPEKFKKKDDGFKVTSGDKIRVWLSASGDKVIAAERRKFINFFKSKTVFYYTNDDLIPDEICLTHRNIRMKIAMNLLEQ